MGHTLSPSNYGAVGLLRESIETREIGRRVIKQLISRGATVVDCTVDNASSQGKSLSERVKKANAQKLDIFVSIHFNKTEGAYGSEIYTYKGEPHKEAIYILSELNKLGFTGSGNKPLSRGIKSKPLYVIDHTKAKSMLIEVCFIDSQRDVNLYLANKDRIAQIICDGILQEVSTPIISDKVDSSKPMPKDDRHSIVKLLQSAINAQGFGTIKVDGIFGPGTLGSCPTIKVGARGDITKAAQRMLLLKGMDIGRSGADGIFGLSTKEAVQRYQSHYGLVDDGIIGRNTWSVLFK